MKILLANLILVTNLLITSNLKANCDEGFESYKKTLYPVLRQSCTKCHDDGGIAPAHSSQNPLMAYQTSLESVSFENISTSNFVKKVRSQHWKSHDPNSEGISEEKITQSLNAWWDQGEFSCVLNKEFTSYEITIPGDLPLSQSNQYKEILWDLGKTNSHFANCNFKIKAQIFRNIANTPISYRFKEPKISCQNKSISGSGLRILYGNKTESFENIYVPVSFATVPAIDYLISDEHMIVVEKENASKTLSIQFEKLK